MIHSDATRQSFPKSRVRSKARYFHSRSLYEIQIAPSSPNLWSSLCSHLEVHSLDRSLQEPFHSPLPQGFLSNTRRFPSASTSRITEYACSARMPPWLSRPRIQMPVKRPNRNFLRTCTR